MALLDFYGFETNGVLPPWLVPSSGLTFPTGRDGAGHACFGGNTSSTLAVTLAAAASTLIVGVGLKFNSSALGSVTGANALTLKADANATSHLSLNVDATGHLTLRRGASNGTIIATATLTVPTDTWFYLEVKATIHDSTGICIVKVDGTEHINFTGDTKNAGTLTTFSGFNLFGSSIYTLDDLVILDGTGSAPNNDFIGDKVVKPSRPNGNGASSQFLGSDGNSTDNYLLTDEDPLNTSDYVGDSTAGNRDLYETGDLTVVGTVHAVKEYIYAQKSDGGSRSIKTAMRSTGGTVVAGATQTLSTTWTLMSSAVAEVDADGSPWTVSTVNSHQFGFETV